MMKQIGPEIYWGYLLEEKTVLISSFNTTVSPPAPHCHNDVRGHLNDRLPQRWFGRAAAGHQERVRWPPRSPDLTPCDSFVWGYIKDHVFVPPLANTLVDLRTHITEIDPNML
jgi:hypothetical protein